MLLAVGCMDFFCVRREPSRQPPQATLLWTSVLEEAHYHFPAKKNFRSRPSGMNFSQQPSWGKLMLGA
jgi:hypothetical protein